MAGLAFSRAVHSYTGNGKPISRKSISMLRGCDFLAVTDAEASYPSAGYAVAVKVATLRASPQEVGAPCPHFGPCGGCSLQNLEYAAQLQAKNSQVGTQQ